MNQKKSDVTACPLISVIVPIYNVEQYIRKCLDSIVVQTYSNLEIILVDDGSPDNCPAICDEYAEKDSRIKVIHKQNGGLSSARNAGLDIMNGDYVGFVDPDDWIAPDMFEYLLDGICAYKAEISICNVIDVKKYNYEYPNLRSDIVFSTQDALDELFSNRIKDYAWNKLYKASLWEKIRYPEGKTFEDILTIYKTFELAERIAVLREAKYFYFYRLDGISNSRDFTSRLNYYKAFVERYRNVTPRLPQYKVQLFSKVREWYCHEISYEVISRPENLELNIVLLKLLSEFVRECKDDIYTTLCIGKIERKKLDAFSLGTVDGCKKSYRYHKKLIKSKKNK